MLISRQVEELAAELRVKEVAIHETPAKSRRCARRPARSRRPRGTGRNLPSCGACSTKGDFEVTDGTLRADGYILSRGEFMLDYTPGRVE
jgi:hypothetical protein